MGILDAVDRQLGLKLEMQRAPTPVLVVDRVNQMPTPNEPGVAAKMNPPPPPPTVEVATIKPSATDGPAGGGFSIRMDAQGGGQLDAKGVRVSTLAQMAWDLPVDRVLGIPQAADSKNYDIMAKINIAGGGISFLSFRAIMKDLLSERFTSRRTGGASD
ncbi:MAG: TIGR03435 family protein [Acidobacteriota bacterium]